MIGTENHTPLNFSINPPNAAPVLNAIGNRTVDEGSTLSLTATATDADVPANTLTFALGAGAPAGAGIDASTGVFTWTPTEAQGPDVYPVTVRVTDSGIPPIDDAETIEITVNEVNTAPVLSTIGNQAVYQGAELSFTATATDADVPANTLIFTLDAGAPAGAGIDSVTGVFSWTPAAGPGPGVYPVTVRAADNGMPVLDDFETIEITVNEILKGDINGDGITDLADAILALRVLSGMDTSDQVRSGYIGSGADVNGDDRVGMEEVIYILQDVVGLR